MAFLNRLFPLELRNRKMQEFINLCQGGMSVKDYRLMFTQLYKNALTMVADSRAKMNKFVMEISNFVVNKCRLAMLVRRMDIARLMVHLEQIYEQKLKQGAGVDEGKNGNYSIRLHLMFKTSKTLRRCFPIKDLLILEGSTRLSCLLPIPKRGNVEDLMLRSLFVQNVIRDMMVSA